MLGVFLYCPLPYFLKYTHICMHIHIYTHMHTYAHIRTHNVFTHAQHNMYTYVYIYTYTYICTYIQMLDQFIYLTCLYVLPVHVYVHHECASCACEGQKKASDSLELE